MARLIDDVDEEEYSSESASKKEDKANSNHKVLPNLHEKHLKTDFPQHYVLLKFEGQFAADITSIKRKMSTNFFSSSFEECYHENSENIQFTKPLVANFIYDLSTSDCETQQLVLSQRVINVRATAVELEVCEKIRFQTLIEYVLSKSLSEVNWPQIVFRLGESCLSSYDTNKSQSWFLHRMYETKSLGLKVHGVFNRLSKSCQFSRTHMDPEQVALIVEAISEGWWSISELIPASNELDSATHCFQDLEARCPTELFSDFALERSLVLCISMDLAQPKISDTYEQEKFQSWISRMRQCFKFETFVKGYSAARQAGVMKKSYEKRCKNNFCDTVKLETSYEPQKKFFFTEMSTRNGTANEDCSLMSRKCLMFDDVADTEVCQAKSNEVSEILCSGHYDTSNSSELDFQTLVKQQFSLIGELYLYLALLILQIVSLPFSLKWEPPTLGQVHRRVSSTFVATTGSERRMRSFVHQDNVDDQKTSSPPPQQPSRHNDPALLPIVLSDSPGSTEAGHENVRRESFRLSSFQHFPPSVPINARQFAAAGFFYTGMYDEVKCFACSNVLRNLTASIDPFLLRMHKPTCRFARGQDECGNVRLGQFGSGPAIAPRSASSTSRPTAGEVLFGAPPSYQNASARSAPAPHLNSSGVPRVRLASQTTIGGPVRHYEGLDMRNYQSARPVAPPPSTYDVPLHRQLATIQNADQARLIRSLNLCRETDRYQTFNADWSLDSAPSGREMAASGWFYLGNLDRTQCFSCGGVLRNWRRLDNPTTEHISHFPHCAMAQGRESRNIPDTSRQAPPPNRSGLNELTTQQRSDLRNMFPCGFPVTPSMRSVQDRVNSFNNWSFTRATPQMIAEAGFYALGVRDRVKCHYCNGGLQNWRQDDNPWEEHAKWYPTCEFLLQQRGPEYIHTIVARFPNINRPILHAPGQDVPPAPQVRSGPPTLQPPPPERQSSGETPRTQEQQQNQDPIDVAMRSEFATTVIGMGFEESLVRDVMRVNIEQHGVGYQSATILLDAVMTEQSAREAQESTPETSMEINLPVASFLDEENMDDMELYESGLDVGGIDVAESGLRSPPPSSLFSPSISMSRSSTSNLFSSTSGQNATSSTMTTRTPHSSLSSLPNVMDTSIEPSFKETAPMAPQGITSLPQPRPQATASKRETELQDRAKSLPEATEDKEELAKKLQQLKDERLCKVCLDRAADMVFIPCGHICCCMECTRALRSCPICRKKIEKAVRTYTS